DPRPGGDLCKFGLPDDRTQAPARGAGAGIAVFQRVIEPGDAGPAVQRQDLDAGRRLLEIPDQDVAAPAVLDDVGRQLGRDQLDAPFGRLGKAAAAGELAGLPARLGYGTALGDRNADHRHYFQRAMVMRVPSPGLEWIENSLDRRFAPPNPSPSPDPV